MHTSPKSQFEKQSVELSTNTLNIKNLVNFYEGILIDEPETSHVSGTIIDGIFYGTITSDLTGKFFIESSKRYNHTLDAHSIIYHENSVNIENTHLTTDDTDTESDKLRCGSSKKTVEDWLKTQQKNLYNQKQKETGFDPYSYVDKDVAHEYHKYSQEAQNDFGHERTKRATKSKESTSPKRVQFPEQRTMCDLYLRVDPQLYTEIYNNEGNEDNVKTVSFILFYLNKHVEALNSVYNGNLKLLL